MATQLERFAKWAMNTYGSEELTPNAHWKPWAIAAFYVEYLHQFDEAPEHTLDRLFLLLSEKGCIERGCDWNSSKVSCWKFAELH